MALATLFKNKNVAMLAGAAVRLTTGGKLGPITIMARALYGLEKEWRERHPEFHGGLRERWALAAESYEATHQHKVNRTMHAIGIPMIAGGFIGMMLSPRYTPPWWVSTASWSVGWTLNLVGHAFEQKPPAFASDPLSFVVGPVWDIVRLRDTLTGRSSAADASPTASFAASA